jgi:hypothetical protein
MEYSTTGAFARRRKTDNGAMASIASGARLSVRSDSAIAYWRARTILLTVPLRRPPVFTCTGLNGTPSASRLIDSYYRY